MTLVFGGTFDPPHVGHVALVEGAKRHFGDERVLVLVVADPGHREVVASAADRLALARAAFPGEDVELDEHPRTIDMLRARRLDDPVLLIGADQLADFPSWKEPEARARARPPRRRRAAGLCRDRPAARASRSSRSSRPRSARRRSAAALPPASRSTASCRPPWPPRSSGSACTGTRLLSRSAQETEPH